MTARVEPGAASTTTRFDRAIALCPAFTHVDHRLAEALSLAGVELKPFIGCSDLPKARSELLSWGLRQPDKDTFLLVDSDVVPTVEQIRRLLRSPRLGPMSAVTGAYVTGDAVISVELIPGEPEPVLGAPGFTRVRSAGLGFCAIRRESLEALRLPTVTLGFQPFCVPFVADTSAGLEYFGDDRSLWKRLRNLDDFELWFDQALIVAHVLRRPSLPAFGVPTAAR